MVAVVSGIVATLDRVIGASSLDGTLAGASSSLSGVAREEALELERAVRTLHMFANLGDAAGQVKACDALIKLSRGRRDLQQSLVDQGVLASLVVVLQARATSPTAASHNNNTTPSSSSSSFSASPSATPRLNLYLSLPPPRPLPFHLSFLSSAGALSS